MKSDIGHKVIQRLAGLAAGRGLGCLVLQTQQKVSEGGLVWNYKPASSFFSIGCSKYRRSSANFVQFLRIAQGSLKETETHIIIAGKLSLAPREELIEVLAICDELGKMIRSLIRAIQDKK